MKIIYFIKKIIINIIIKVKKRRSLVNKYIQNGRIPWSEGYVEYKEKFINDILLNEDKMEFFKIGKLPVGYGIGIDERCVEYPWIFSKINSSKGKLLDAGSTFNFEYILKQNILKNKDMTIFTFFPEKNCFYQNKISYVYGDLRDLMFRNNYFDLIVSHSTIEHIDMDNAIYGYSKSDVNTQKNFEFLKAIDEMLRVLVPGGRLLLTFPFGVFENHGFFQQFDSEMLDALKYKLLPFGEPQITFFKYEKTGWCFSTLGEVQGCVSFNPHTGKGKGEDGAAHSRAIACVDLVKNI